MCDKSGNASIKAVRETLSAADARMTPQREAVLRALLERLESHQSAEEVLAAAREFCPELGLATVYRALELFSKLGVVRRLDTAEGQARFEFNQNGTKHYHHHVICLRCGMITEFNEDLLEVIEARVVDSTGFRIVDHCLRIYGYCPECASEDPDL